MKILIAGDLVPTDSNLNLFEKGDIKSLLGQDLEKIWMESDFRIFNLETPITDVESPILKNGPNLIAPTSTIRGIKALNPTLLTLANNHILDQGLVGLKSTKEILMKHNIPYVGVGDDLSKASEPYILKYNGKSIGIYACAEHEFSIAGVSTPGVNPFDPLESLDHIQALKKKCDYVIVLYHGGKEHYRYPSPNLQKVCRKMAEKGADFIICQHSHCIGCKEEYRGSLIVYGQGNFIFNKYNNEYWNTSLIIKIVIDEQKKVEYIPIVSEGNGVRLAIKDTAQNILLGFHQRSEEILRDGFVEKQYKSFARKNKDMYLRKFAGFGKWISRIDRILLNGMLIKKRYSKRQLLALQNYIECEAHAELLLAALKGEIESERE